MSCTAVLRLADLFDLHLYTGVGEYSLRTLARLVGITGIGGS